MGRLSVGFILFEVLYEVLSIYNWCVVQIYVLSVFGILHGFKSIIYLWYIFCSSRSELRHNSECVCQCIGRLRCHADGQAATVSAVRFGAAETSRIFAWDQHPAAQSNLLDVPV